MLQDLIIPAITVGISELGDKTQLAVLSLSGKHKNKTTLFLAVMLAFILVNAIAVALGSVASTFLPVEIITIGAGIIFIAYGAYILTTREEGSISIKKDRPFLSITALIFMLELGDKSQAAAILFSAKYNPILVFLGVQLALAALTIMAIIIGAQLAAKLNPTLMQYASGTLFIIIGIITLL